MKAPLLAIFVIAILTLPAPATSGRQAGDDDLETRGFFLRSRPKTRGEGRPRAPDPHKHAGPAAPAAEPPARDEHRAATPPATPPPTAGAPAAPVALGYSIFRESTPGVAVRVDPSQTFKVGDKLRLQLEPNVDGYLYVFYTESGRKPTMLYPDSRLAGGNDQVTAHGLVEIPSRNDPQHQWFKLVGKPAVERLYIVVSREPLPGVPIADELVRYCATYQDACPWIPPEELWRGIVALAGAPVDVSMIADAGKRQTQEEQEVVTREIVLSSVDAEPTVISVSAGSSDVLVSTVDIKHE